MKKWIAMLMALIVLCVPALAEEDWYLTTAGELTEAVGELVRDEVYQESMTSMHLDCVAAIQDADFATVKRAYRTAFPVQKIRDWIKSQGQDLTGLTDAAWDRIVVSVPQMMLSMYNGRQSVDAVAASSIISVSRTYVMPEGFESCLLILELEGAVVGAAFLATGEDTVTVVVQPLFCPANETAEDVLRQFREAKALCDFQQIK